MIKIPWLRRTLLHPKESSVSRLLVGYLSDMDVFKDLSQLETEALFEGMMVRECQRGTVFFTPDESTEQVFVLKSGEVQLYRLDFNGQRLVIRRVGPGTIFGEMGLLGETVHGCFAEAVEDSLVCIASRDEMFQLLRRKPEVALRVLEIVGGRLNTLERRLERLALSPVNARLADLLLTLALQDTGEVVGYSHAELGDMIGAGRQIVTETLGKMKAEGLVATSHKHVRIIQEDELRRMGELM